ncbi:MAG TPA: tryptophan--tRNA ligase [Porphyromonadaceae bacterium]|nr:tryptophan--tRNA ligase [Porphyromonadaceae bacterium]
MEIVVSGIRPTGVLHLGNYFGALKNFVKMQHEDKCFFFVADYHSLTTHTDALRLYPNVCHIFAEYLAAGLDPEACTLFVQSDVPEVAEMSLLLSMHAYKGELEKTVSFKDKARKNPDNVNAGLLTYPVLMASDIIIHHATKVPVGKDQEQHLEMTRNFCQRFNRIYNVEYFPLPTAYNFGNQLVKVPGLDGTGKMGKSEGNGIFLVDDPKNITKKVMKAVTDGGPQAPNSVKPEVIENLFTLLKLVSNEEVVKFFEEAWNNCSIRYGDLKKQLANDIITLTEPIRQRILEIESNKEYLEKVMKIGKEKAQESARKTLKEVREIMGFRKSM